VSDGSPVHERFDVYYLRIPVGAAGANTLDVTATTTGGTTATAAATLQLPPLYPSLAAAFDNVGVSANSDPAAGNLDGDGDSYSAEGLAAAGLTPGATFTEGGVTFTWPDAAPGQPDNVLAAGQTIAVSGSGSELGFVGTSDYGSSTGSGFVVYTDGTVEPFTIGFSDWYHGTAPTVSAGHVVATSIWNHSSGPGHHVVGLYWAEVPLDPAKTVKEVVLPDVSNHVGVLVTAMHVFSIGFGH
jgi:hypothetical protein